MSEKTVRIEEHVHKRIKGLEDKTAKAFDELYFMYMDIKEDNILMREKLDRLLFRNVKLEERPSSPEQLESLVGSG